MLNSEATRERIIDEIEKLRANLGVNDLGIVAFSGYEWIGERGEFYILPYDGDPKRPSETAISAADIFRAMPNSRGKVVLWLDTCHSGQMAKEMEDVNPTIMTFASCAANEMSVELESARGGLFTSTLVRGLDGEADKNKDGLVALDELAEFAASTTRTVGSKQGIIQNPVIAGAPGSLPVTAPAKHEN